MAGLPLGGGKAVILADPSADKTAVLTAYARQVERLGGRFITGEDVGISEAEADLIHQGTQFIAGLSGRRRARRSKSGALPAECSVRCTPLLRT